MCVCVFFHEFVSQVTYGVQKSVFSLHNVDPVNKNQVLMLPAGSYALSHLTGPTLTMSTFFQSFALGQKIYIIPGGLGQTGVRIT